MDSVVLSEKCFTISLDDGGLLPVLIEIFLAAFAKTTKH